MPPDDVEKPRSVQQRLRHDLGREPVLSELAEATGLTVEEIAKILDLRREDVVFALDAILEPVSLYDPIYSDGGDTICVMDQVKDSKNTDESWLEHIALKEAMARLTPFQRRFVILHEEGHYALNTDDEIRADAYAFDRLAGTEARSLRQSVESLEQILDDDNPTLRPRYRALLRRALEWDADHGNPRAAAELGRVSYASGRSKQDTADALYTLAQGDALLDQTYYAGEAQLLQGRANIVLYLVAGLVAALYLL